MSKQKGYAIWERGKGVIIASYPRFNQARIKCEQMNASGTGRYYIQEDWDGVPVSIITRTRVES